MGSCGSPALSFCKHWVIDPGGESIKIDPVKEFKPIRQDRQLNSCRQRGHDLIVASEVEGDS
jgi:hypothetical protein